MKLTYFSAQTMPNGSLGLSNGVPRINFGAKGAIRLNPASCKLIGLKPGDKITIAQDEDKPENWYVFKDNAHGFEIRVFSDKKSHGFNHGALVSLFKDAMGITETTRGLSYGISPDAVTLKGETTKYWKILIN